MKNPDTFVANDGEPEQFLIMWASNPVGLSSVLGPASAFRAVGTSLRPGPGRRELMRFRRGAWYRRGTGRGASLLWTDDPATLRFADSTTGKFHPLGTFEMIGVVSDTIYVDREHSRAVARLDEATQMWRCCVDGTPWPELVILPAPQLLLPWESKPGPQLPLLRPGNSPRSRFGGPRPGDAESAA